MFFFFSLPTFSPVVLHLEQFVENVVGGDGDEDSIEMFHVANFGDVEIYISLF